ncbi:HAD family hydrolase [Limimonas halophila]|nr:HAD family hydrolase [Limimonas halophila]
MSEGDQNAVSRREAVKLAGVGALATTAAGQAVAPRAAKAGPLKTKAIFFDVGGTMLDWTVMPAKIEAYLGERNISVDGGDYWPSWRSQLFAYMMYNTMIDRAFVPLEELATRATLAHAQKSGLDMDRDTAGGIYPLLGELDTYDEILPSLKRMRGAGYKLVPHTQLSEPVLRRALLGRFDWDWFFTSESFAMYKPNRPFYFKALDELGLDVAEVLYVSSNQFDVFAAKGLGFRVIWVDRWDQALEPYGYTPDWRVRDFAEAADMLETETP